MQATVLFAVCPWQSTVPSVKEIVNCLFHLRGENIILPKECMK